MRRNNNKGKSYHASSINSSTELPQNKLHQDIPPDEPLSYAEFTARNSSYEKGRAPARAYQMTTQQSESPAAQQSLAIISSYNNVSSYVSDGQDFQDYRAYKHNPNQHDPSWKEEAAVDRPTSWVMNEEGNSNALRSQVESLHSSAEEYAGRQSGRETFNMSGSLLEQRKLRNNTQSSTERERKHRAF